jgi:hypothetical protein
MVLGEIEIEMSLKPEDYISPEAISISEICGTWTAAF